MKLNTEQITKNYRFWNEINILAKEAFPPEEYLSPSKLLEMSNDDNFNFLALTDNSSFVGFAVVKIYKNLAYLFFLAIDSSKRSKGYGSSAIKTLKAKYPDKNYVVDFEMPDKKAINNKQRKKRRNFYLRNGYKETGIFLSYFGVDYEIFCTNNNFNLEEFKEMMSTIQIDNFAPKYFFA